ncbi:hypothetical protein F5B18DRAFT_610011 [Nemania serpens]|nr:hypothetical protein F5B18DRAFT_610011 [Nemania serpens]
MSSAAAALTDAGQTDNALIASCNYKLPSLNNTITTAAEDSVKKIAAEKAIKPLCSQIKTASAQAESPVDYTETQTNSMPLASDSMHMEVQYFLFNSNIESAEAYASTIATFLSPFWPVTCERADQKWKPRASQGREWHRRMRIKGIINLEHESVPATRSFS